MCVIGRAEVHSGVSKYRELVGYPFPVRAESLGQR
jgi:hypothetical protein